MSFRINRVYTRSGDDGGTALVGGKRVRKTNSRVAAYGNLDEINSQLGVVKELCCGECNELYPVIEQLQQELFDLGSELATPAGDSYLGMWHVEKRHIEALEKLCDRFGDGLPELTSFILPGGSALAAQLHVARTVARRAERELVMLYDSTAAEDAVSIETVQYLNRLSDLLFILARWCLRQQGKEAPLWKKEAER